MLLRRLARISLQIQPQRPHAGTFRRSMSAGKEGNGEDEVANAAKAARAGAFDENAPTIFDKIIDGSIPSSKVYEDEFVLCFDDIAPQAPTHVVCIPKERDGLTGIDQAEMRHESILGKLMIAAKTVADIKGLEGGYRVVVNNGRDGAQSVGHLHLHVLGGRQMTWPPG